LNVPDERFLLRRERDPAIVGQLISREGGPFESLEFITRFRQRNTVGTDVELSEFRPRSLRVIPQRKPIISVRDMCARD